MARLRNFVRKMVHEVLELCCFEWFQNRCHGFTYIIYCFRAVLFRMVPKPFATPVRLPGGFRAVLFRMVPKLRGGRVTTESCFRAVLFRMVPKQSQVESVHLLAF